MDAVKVRVLAPYLTKLPVPLMTLPKLKSAVWLKPNVALFNTSVTKLPAVLSSK